MRLGCGRQIVSGRQLLGRIRERGAGALPHSRPDPNPALARRERAGAPGLAAALDSMRREPLAVEGASGGLAAAEGAHEDECVTQGAYKGASAAEGACGYCRSSCPGSGASAAAAAVHEAAGWGCDTLGGASAHAGTGSRVQEPLVLELEVSGRITATGVRSWAPGPLARSHGEVRSGPALGRCQNSNPNQGTALGDSTGGWEMRTAYYDGAGALMAEEAGGWLWRRAGSGNPGASGSGSSDEAAGAAQHSVLRTTTPLVQHMSFLARDGASVRGGRLAARLCFEVLSEQHPLALTCVMLDAS